ncbi:MAG: tyrosine-type recombinase/integrase [Edaphobacter sp.]
MAARGCSKRRLASFVDTIRPIYEPEEITAMFKVATEDEADMLKFILGSGFRDQEIRYGEYLDLDSKHDLVRVTAKKEWDFTPKNWEERIVPLPHVLMERLTKRKERKKARPHDLIFGNTRGNPDSEMDTVVKRVAERAGLNCGRCVTEHGNKCAEGPVLHEFLPPQVPAHLRHQSPARRCRHPQPCRHGLDTATSNPRWSTSRASDPKMPHTKSTTVSWRVWWPRRIDGFCGYPMLGSKYGVAVAAPVANQL